MTLKLNGSSSGFTAIDAPASAGSNTLVLPTGNGSAGQILQTDGSGNLTWVDKPLTVADQWRVTANFDSSSTDPVSSDWERVDHASQGTIGTAMSVSSGIWTFPVTGIYQVTFHTQWKEAGNIECRYSDTQILGTTNNSSYDAIAVSTQGQGHGGTGENYVHNSAMSLVDVTDTSNVKVKFKVTAQSTVTWIGHTQNNSIYATFVRVGDT